MKQGSLGHTSCSGGKYDNLDLTNLLRLVFAKLSLLIHLDVALLSGDVQHTRKAVYGNRVKMTRAQRRFLLKIISPTPPSLYIEASFKMGLTPSKYPPKAQTLPYLNSN